MPIMDKAIELFCGTKRIFSATFTIPQIAPAAFLSILFAVGLVPTIPTHLNAQIHRVCGRKSPSKILRSVPQIPQYKTLTKASPFSNLGTDTSFKTRGLPNFSSTNAFIL